MDRFLTCAKAPCKSCPYRRDVPSGVWDKTEYDKLPAYDGSFIDQLGTPAAGIFMCHQQDGKMCAGWIGTHGARNLVALRITNTRVDPSVYDYATRVPLFKSGAEARAHGMKGIRRPKKEAKEMIANLAKRQAIRQRRAAKEPATKGAK